LTKINYRQYDINIMFN